MTGDKDRGEASGVETALFKQTVAAYREAYSRRMGEQLERMEQCYEGVSDDEEKAICIGAMFLAALEHLNASRQPFLIYGAGAIGRFMARWLDNAAGFVDRDASLQGTSVDALPVFSPEDAAVQGYPVWISLIGRESEIGVSFERIVRLGDASGLFDRTFALGLLRVLTTASLLERSDAFLDTLKLLMYRAVHLSANHTRIVLYGTGSVARLLAPFFVASLEGFCDRDDTLGGRRFYNRPVMTPEMLSETSFDRVVTTLLGREGTANDSLDAFGIGAGRRECILGGEAAHLLQVSIDISKMFSEFTERPDVSVTDPEKMDDAFFRVPVRFPAEPHPAVTVIVPVYNQFKHTYVTLFTLMRCAGDTAMEVIVADDHSTDPELRAFLEDAENVTVVRGETNRGFLENCNHAAGYARGRYLFFLNNDTNVQEGSIRRLVELMERDETVGLCGSKLVYPDLTLQEAGGIVWSDGSAWNYGRHQGFFTPECNYLKEADYISGAAILVRKSLWDEIGGFDSRFAPAYYEDTDLAMSVRARGYRVVYHPHSVVVHFEGISHGTDEGSGLKRHQQRNRQKFYEKWRQCLEGEHCKPQHDLFLARDRSRGRPHTLVVDHQVPTYDQDSGSRMLWQYLELLVALGHRVTFVPANYHKHQPYVSELQALGIEVLYGQTYQYGFEAWLEAHGRYIDFVYLLRPHVATAYLEMVRQHTDAKVVYNGTDLHSLRLMREYEVSGNAALLERAEAYRAQEQLLHGTVDAIVNVSEYESQLLRGEFPLKPIYTIPNFFYERAFPFSSRAFEAREGLLFVGGFRHTPNVDAMLWFVKKVWPEIAERVPDLRLYIVGSHPPPEIAALADDAVEVTGFVSDEALEAYYERCRVCVVPLRYGAGVKGKVVEAVAQGIPLVTTEIGAEGLDDGSGALRVASEAAFADEVCRLYGDRALWEHTRRRQVAYAQTQLSRAAALDVWKKIFR